MTTIQEIRKSTGLSQPKFSERFGISIYTLRNWEQEKRTAPPHILSMLQHILELEKENEEYKREIEKLRIEIAKFKNS